MGLLQIGPVPPGARFSGGEGETLNITDAAGRDCVLTYDEIEGMAKHVCWARDFIAEEKGETPMKRYEGRVKAGNAEDNKIWIEMTDGVVEFRAGGGIVQQAMAHIGQLVRFEVELSYETQQLTHPVFVIGSQCGLRAVRVDEVPDTDRSA